SVLTIRGCPILITYWLENIIYRYFQGTPKAFWLEFSMDGHNMSFTVIVTILQKQHQVNKQDIVIIAYKKYGEEFDAKFLYQKKDKIHVISNASGIVHYYQKLKII
ncbi:hypothetical protein C8R48DRAFT_594048, partial [Suillus tomentosus]